MGTHVAVSNIRNDVSGIRHDMSKIQEEIGGQVRPVSTNHIQPTGNMRSLTVG